jgi:hypothetical protein
MGETPAEYMAGFDSIGREGWTDLFYVMKGYVRLVGFRPKGWPLRSYSDPNRQLEVRPGRLKRLLRSSEAPRGERQAVVFTQKLAGCESYPSRNSS